MSKTVRFILLTVLASIVVLAILAFSLPKPSGDGLALEEVPFYSLPWNDNPFFPGEITTGDGKFANGETVPSAEFCAQCHKPEYKQWVSSIHAVSTMDQIYEITEGVNVDAHKSRLGLEKTRWCESCHTPLAVAMGEISPIPAVGPSVSAEGTTCIVCHTVTDTDPLAGNGAMVLDINNINNYLDPALIMAAPNEHAKAMQAKTHNPLMGKADMCGACHTEIRLPEVYGEEKMHFQNTFEEWQGTEYAKMDIHCQDCHMHPNPAEYIAELKKTGEKPERVVSHRFVGNNYLLTAADLPANLVTFLRGGHPPGDISTEEWKEDLLVQQGLIINLLQEAGDLEINAQETVTAGKEASLDLVVTNSGAGHNLPTGPLDQRYMWLELEVTDANGQVLHHSGWFDDKTGQVDPDGVIYLKVMRDKEGNHITRHVLFNVEEYNFTRNPIPAKESDTVPYTFAVPDNVQGPLTVKSTLWYKLALQEIVKYNLQLDVIVPPIPIAEATMEIPVK